MPNLSKKTIAKMRAVVAAVLAEPEFYNQQWFPQEEDCGQICCAAGWAVWNENPKRYVQLVKQSKFDVNWPYEAEKALGFSDPTMAMFGTQRGWPWQFTDMYNNARSDKQRAQAMAARWEFYIATDGTDHLAAS